MGQRHGVTPRRPRRTHRRFVDRVEHNLLEQDYELLVARFEAECYRTAYQDAEISGHRRDL